MLQKYGDQIAPLERYANSQGLGLTLLVLSNLTLAFLSIVCGSLPLWQVVVLAIFPGSIFSLWQLQILHDNVHGCLLDKQTQSFTILPNVFTVSKRHLQDAITFWGSMPSAFGYYLYLKYGHLSHHALLGSASLEQVFESSSRELDDGDVLFVAHRMNLLGNIGPKLSWNTNVDVPILGSNTTNNLSPNSITLSISRFGFSFWKPGQAVWNAAVFATSFLFERVLLVFNDVVVALTGRNFFFPNKPIQEFQEPCAVYSRCAVLVRLLLLVLGGSWKTLFFLYLAETVWSLPPHPACAMFITNHGSNHNNMDDESSTGKACIPTSSTYAGRWYSILTLGTNYHTEHHDFPTIPFQKLARLHQIAPEFYTLQRNSSYPIVDNLCKVMTQAFETPNYYACMNDLHLAGVTGRSDVVPMSNPVTKE
jgi:fatty acid desaturase